MEEIFHHWNQAKLWFPQSVSIQMLFNKGKFPLEKLGEWFYIQLRETCQSAFMN